MKNVPAQISRRRVLSLLLLGLILLPALVACVREDDLTPDQRAYTLDRELMCPVCDGQTIDQSHAQIAVDMKEIVREKIAAGESNQEIRSYFVARYGEVVLAAPEASGFNLIVWLMPVVIAGAGALAVVLVLRNMRRSAGGVTDATARVAAADRQLEKYLAKVDADTGVRDQLLQKEDLESGREIGRD